MRSVCGLFVLPGSIKISIAIFQMVLYLLTIITYFLHFSIPFSPFYFRLESILKSSSSFFIPLKMFHYCFMENHRIKAENKTAEFRFETFPEPFDTVTAGDFPKHIIDEIIFAAISSSFGAF